MSKGSDKDSLMSDLMFAIKNNKIQKVEEIISTNPQLLLENSATLDLNPEYSNITPVLYSIACRNSKIALLCFEKLDERGVDLGNIQMDCTWGHNILEFADFYNCNPITREIIKTAPHLVYESNPSAKEEDYKGSILHRKIGRGCYTQVAEFIQELEKKGVFVDDTRLQDKVGDKKYELLDTALMERFDTVINGTERKFDTFKVVELLANKKHKLISIKNADGNPPPHVAIKHNKEKELQLFIEICERDNKDIKSITNARGQTPLEFAKECKASQSIQDILRKAEARAAVSQPAAAHKLAAYLPEKPSSIYR